jgi:hypothetical protein
MLTFMPSGRFTKSHAFCTEKMETQIFEAKLESPFRRVVGN